MKRERYLDPAHRMIDPIESEAADPPASFKQDQDAYRSPEPLPVARRTVAVS